MGTCADKSVNIKHDANDNVIITGEGNLVIIQTSRVQAVASEAVAIEGIPPNPYVGLSAFREEDANRFFGRVEQVRQLWMKFRELYETSLRIKGGARLLTIHGPSGCGKSSIARAGLIPELARRPLPGLDKARVASLTPGVRPLSALAAVLARIALNDPAPVAKTREFVSELKRKSECGKYDGLRRIADTLPGINSSRLIIFVDQFEEVYGLCNDKKEREVFVENILEATSDRSGYVSAIVTLRCDFLYETQQNHRLNTAISQHGILVPIMTEEQLRQAICQPAINAGHPLDESLVLIQA